MPLYVRFTVIAADFPGRSLGPATLPLTSVGRTRFKSWMTTGSAFLTTNVTEPQGTVVRDIESWPSVIVTVTVDLLGLVQGRKTPIKPVNRRARPRPAET